MDLGKRYDKLYRYCYLKTRHPQAAEEVTQETFLRFLRTHDVEDMERYTPYLYTIARNFYVDFHRARQGRLVGQITSYLLFCRVSMDTLNDYYLAPFRLNPIEFSFLPYVHLWFNVCKRFHDI